MRGGKLTVEVGYGLQIGHGKGLSRKRSLATTKKPASAQNKLVMFAVTHRIFCKHS